MSIRAYKIKKILHKENPTFNLSQEFDWIMSHSYWQSYNQDGEIYTIEFAKDDIVEALEHTINPEKLEVLNAVKDDFGREDYVMYYCF